MAAPPEAPLALDIRAEGIGSVIWCTGFGPDTGWMDVPVLRADGVPVHNQGITACPGLYVAGYPWLSTRGSGILYGVAADAARIAQHIAAVAKGHAGVDTAQAAMHAAVTPLASWQHAGLPEWPVRRGR